MILRCPECESWGPRSAGGVCRACGGPLPDDAPERRPGSPWCPECGWLMTVRRDRAFYFWVVAAILFPSFWPRWAVDCEVYAVVGGAMAAFLLALRGPRFLLLRTVACFRCGHLRVGGRMDDRDARARALALRVLGPAHFVTLLIALIFSLAESVIFDGLKPTLPTAMSLNLATLTAALFHVYRPYGPNRLLHHQWLTLTGRWSPLPEAGERPSPISLWAPDRERTERERSREARGEEPAESA